MKSVIFYRTESGKCPVEDFLDSLPSKAAQKAAWVLMLIEERKLIDSKYFKKLVGTDDIWECRINHGSNAYRILCFITDDENVVLTNGFAKKKMKVPRSEIAKAEARKKDFLIRGEQDERP